jgi:7-carboxy-7-deazaguanine synthase
MTTQTHAVPTTELTFPVAEIFYSIQGEGHWTGTPMFFVRLAGCTVGKPATAPTPFQLLHPEHTTCTSYDGQTFICDTDYRVKERLTVSQLRAAIPSKCQHVVLTGGEPFMHRGFTQLVQELTTASAMAHIETSGTIQIQSGCDAAWVTCSPKAGFLPGNTPHIDEYKFLIREPVDVARIKTFLNEYQIDSRRTRVYVQPIDEMSESPHRAVAVQMVKENPSWRLSFQAHKWWGLR